MLKAAIRNPYAVFVVVAIAVMFGLISLMTIPIQLKPTIEPPEISIETIYWGASPLEVEDQITNKIEKEVATINDLDRIISNSQEGVSTIQLVFMEGTDRNKSLIDTIQAMKRVTDLPDLAVEPKIQLVTGGQGEEIMWLNVDGGASLDEKWDMVEQTLQPALLRVSGVGGVVYFGGVERKIIVEPDPQRLALHGISLNQLAGVIAAENMNARGGYLDEGDRQFMVRTLGKYENLEDVKATVITHGSNGTITVGDVAEVVDGRDRKVGYVHVDGIPSVVMGVSRQSGANVVDTIRRLQAEIANYNNRFDTAGIDIEIVEVYSEIHYVTEAINLVRNNLLIGAILASLVLGLFLRAGRPIGIILTTIPVSLITVFIVLSAMGRTINIISLAGLAFSVGIVVDNAIVVLENIDRHMKELGKPPAKAALDAISEIAGAVFASTMTTVAVFIPVVLNTTEAGLLFKDIAIAIVSAVLASLLSAYTVVPSMGALFMRVGSWREKIIADHPELSKTLDLFELQWIGRWVENGYKHFLEWSCSGKSNGSTGGRVFLLVGVFVVFLASLILLPHANYLPNGTREFIFCFAKPLVGQRNEVSIDTMAPVEQLALNDPRCEGCFAVGAQPFFTGVGIMLDRKQSTEENLQDLTAQIGKVGFQLPGFQFFIPNRTSIFNTQDKQFTLEVTGPELEELKKTGDALQGGLFGMMPDLVTFAFSQYAEGVPELAVELDRNRMAELGLNLQTVAMGIEMMLGGRDISTFTEAGREYDLMIRGDQDSITTRDELAAFTFTTPMGKVIRLDEIAKIVEGTGPSSIRHYNRQRSIEYTVTTNPMIPTQVALDIVDESLVKPMEAGMGPGYSIRFGDAADKLRETMSSLAVQGLLAVIIVYLLMVALFRSFGYPLVILVTIPLAMSGSFLAMSFANRISGGIIQFDVLGMLGLIILTGIVVNNAILIVHQMINNQEGGMSPLAALRESARTRLRPIFMSVLTSVFGMLPLALGHGSGSELYRGLGIIVVGGLFISTVFTLFVVPTILSLVQERSERRLAKQEQAN